MKKKEERVIFTLIILFMVSFYGYNLRRIWEPSKEKIERDYYQGILERMDISGMEEVEESSSVSVLPCKQKNGRRCVTATVYNPVEDQCDSDPLVTADNSNIDLLKLKKKQIRWIAVSQDLLGEYKYGDQVHLLCKENPKINGVYIIHDCMNKRFRDRIDILTHVDNGTTGLWNVTIKKI